MPFIRHTREGEPPLDVLALADPDIAETISNTLIQCSVVPDDLLIRRLVDDIMYGLSLDEALGRKIVNGYLTLLPANPGRSTLERYSDEVRKASQESVSLAGIIAASLAPVLAFGDDNLLDDFFRAVSLIKTKWFLAMTAAPLEILSDLVGPDDISAGRAWLAFLHDLFGHDLTYNQYRRFTGRIPKAVLAFPAAHRAWRLEQMRRVVQHDFNLACVLTESLGNQLSLLSEDELSTFVSEGLARYQQDKERGMRFLGLASASSRERCSRLQTTAVFAQVRPRLMRYLQARCGHGVNIQLISSLPDSFAENHLLSAFDGQTIYLADTMSRYPDHAANVFLYKALAWVEAGLYEFGTFDFDFEKALVLCGRDYGAAIDDNKDVSGSDLQGDSGAYSGPEYGTDVERFFTLFSNPGQAAGLFTIFEYGRIRTLAEELYPGGAKRFYGFLRDEAARFFINSSVNSDPRALYALIVLGCSPSQVFSSGIVPEPIALVRQLFYRHTAGADTPEASALGVHEVLGDGTDAIRAVEFSSEGKAFPFHFCIRPSLFSRAFGKYDQYATELKQRIEKNGTKAYKSDIMKRLRQQGGLLYRKDIEEISMTDEQEGVSCDNPDTPGHLSDIDLSGLKDRIINDSQVPTASSDQTSRYKEWDCHLGDYLTDHVLVREHDNAASDSRFYQLALARNQGLVKKIRYAFELLKPEGISRLRHWPEGDEFDYRQLLNFALDKKSGRTPSDRIYIKRLKSQRDVAVSLLIDFSRSTSNVALGEDTITVMDIQKEAAVLFCEALDVVGDTFAVAGFSGTGRLGVDYFLIKDFEQRMTEDVRRRLGAMRPRRNTRMGAAVRHAAAALDKVSARSKLLIIISDGFPNDVDYKRDYALADTRRALLEAKARQMAVHAITVNISEQAMLDQLYGKVSHSVISNVRQLPDKLLRIYGRLTG